MPHDLTPWITIFRDVVLPLAALIITVVLKKKYGIEIDLLRDQQRSTRALNGVLLAEQRAHSQYDSLPNDGVSKREVAMEYAVPANAGEEERKRTGQQIEIEKAKVNLGLVAPKAALVITSRPPPPTEVPTPIPSQPLDPEVSE